MLVAHDGRYGSQSHLADDDGTYELPATASTSSTPSTSPAISGRATFTWATPVFIGARPGSNQVASQNPMVPSKAPLTGVSCPSIRLCVVADGRGYVWTSTNTWSKTPISGVGHRSQRHPERNMALRSMTFRVHRFRFPRCGRPVLGETSYRETPAGGKSQWTHVYSEPGLANPFDAISCVSTAFCVASDSGGDLVTSLHPAMRRARSGNCCISRGVLTIPRCLRRCHVHKDVYVWP